MKNLHDFLQMFLPDFKAKVHGIDVPIEYIKSLTVENLKAICFGIVMQETYFPEALQNFADKLCERQREDCAECYSNAFEDFDASVYVHLCDAPQPTIEEILGNNNY